MEYGTSFLAGRHPNPTVVDLNDRAADRKAHPHPVLFGRKKRLENLIDVGWGNTDAGIGDPDMHTIAVECGAYRQDALLHRTHGIDGIHDQIQNHLLHLDSIAEYRRKLIA